MASKGDIQWFKKTFWKEIDAAVAGTVFDADMLIAVATQETGSLWSPMRKKGLSKKQIVQLCCGDTLDSDKGRKAFPKTKAHLVAHPRGDEMFQIARTALLNMAEHVPGYGFAKNRPNKFCHGFGVFQYDLQFFKVDPDYFLERRYEKFSETLGKALEELKSALKKRKLHTKSEISDFEFCTVAITYNTGRYRPNRGLKQGHFDGSKYYGQHINDYLAIARGIPAPGSGAKPSQDGTAVVTKPLVPSAKGPKMRVDTMTSPLRLRSEPKISKPLTKNVLADLPDGWPVRAFTGDVINGFIEIEVRLDGTLFRGFSSADFLVKDATTTEPEEFDVLFPAVSMPRKKGTVTKRTQIAGAHSLNEKNMPTRKGDTPDELREELAAIIRYLEPAKKSHKRYQPRSGLTFCNIYAHDYCMLGGVYLPRVWWNDKALIQIAKGTVPEPRYGKSIREMRANDLFRWLRDYGPQHGWVRARSTTELQNNANRGAVSVIVARRKQDGRSGHIVAVVPETDKHHAKRLSNGEVSSPLQSQAGSVNFNYGTGRSGWWRAARFAEFAMWYHS